MDIFNPTSERQTDTQTFVGSAVGSNDWRTWVKPMGCTMAYIVLVGRGGDGGAGAIGAVSTAAGGGGGGSGGVSKLLIPLCMLPDLLYLRLPISAGSAFISAMPNTTTNHMVLVAAAGSDGGNASGATAGVFGAGGTASSVGAGPLAGGGTSSFLAGQNGTAGGTTGVGSALTLPLTGCIATGGTGGGGLPASGAGSGGGTHNVITAPSILSGVVFATGGSSTTTPPANGSSGRFNFNGLQYFFGGMGGGSTHATATGAGLVQSSGGDGAPGCGGGGSGGALTGSTPGTPGLGGPSWCQIVCW